MRALHRLQALVRNLFRRSVVDRDLQDELASYVELAADEERAKGIAPTDAERRARVRLGGAASVTETVRGARMGAGLEQLFQDVQYAVRGLARSPGYAVAAILTLGLGIGANMAVFTVVDAALFKSLPYRDPDQLVIVAQVLDRNTPRERRQIGMTWRQVDRWREEPGVFAALATVVESSSVQVDGFEVPPGSRTSRISPNLMATLGTQPILGRGFLDDEVAGDSAVVLAEEFWRRAYGADVRALGQSIRIDARTRTIVGVAPASMRWGIGGAKVVAWLPLDDRAQRQSGSPFVEAIARLRPGLTVSQGQLALQQALRDRPSGPVNSRYDADLMPFDSREAFGESIGRAHAMAALLGAVGLVLLIGCANVANMVLTRVIAREREIAVRAALGATRRRLFRQFATEGAVLVGVGALVAVALASWTVGIVPAVVPNTLALFEVNPTAFDHRTFGVFALSVVVAALVCCLVPAIRGSRAIAVGELTAGARATSAGGRHWLRLSLQAGQIAMTLILLAGAGLLAVSLTRMVLTPDGYDAEHLANAELTLTAPDADALFNALLARVRGLPGVQASYGPAPTGGFFGRLVAFGKETDARTPGIPSIFYVDADYFDTTGVTLKAGRLFTQDEVAIAAPVSLVDERTAAVLWPGQPAIGQRFNTSSVTPWVTVVGIVGHIKTRWFTETDGTLQVYVPSRMQGAPTASYRSLLVRSDNTPETLNRIADLVRSFNPAFREIRVAPVRNQYAPILVQPRFFAVLMSSLAVIALLTAAIGLYGVVNYAVRERTREIGVRIALGADLNRVRRMVVGEALRPMIVGILAGLMGAWWFTRYLGSLLYQTSPHDPMAFGAVVAILLAVAAIAAYLPARRATRINPVETLRAE